MLSDYILDSLVLMLGVCTGALLIGVPAAWLTSIHEFPGRRLFEWALLLPMAIPAYIIAYTYVGLLEFAGPVQSALRTDQIGILDAEWLLQWDTAYNLYHRPVDRFVADFIGQGVFLPGQMGEGSRVCTELGDIDGIPTADCTAGDWVEVLVRPDDVTHDDASSLTAEIIDRAFRGAEFLYTLRLPSGARLLCLAPSHHNHALGERIGIRLDIDHLVIFRRESGHDTVSKAEPDVAATSLQLL